MAATKKPRIAWIDLLETIAIILVVFYHCSIRVGRYTAGQMRGDFVFYYILQSIFTVCVPLFFFANGFLLFRKDFDLKKHFKKTLKFIILALVWYVITLGILVLDDYQNLATDGLIATLASVKSGANHLWYLGALVCIYLFFPLLKVCYDKNRQVFLYFVLICFIFTFGNTLLNEGLTLLSPLFSDTPTLYHEVNFFKIFNPFRGILGYTFVYFCLGGLVNYYYEKIIEVSPRKRNVIAIISILIGYIGNFCIGLMYSDKLGNIWDIVYNGYDTIFTLITTLGIFLLCLNLKTEHKFFITVSTSTLGIYLIHMLIILLTKAWFFDFLETARPIGIMHHLASIGYGVIIFILSLGITLIIKRIPLLKRLV